MYPGSYPGDEGVAERVGEGRLYRSGHLSGVPAQAPNGHCNHLNDGCECFRDYSMHRKVNNTQLSIL